MFKIETDYVIPNHEEYYQFKQKYIDEFREIFLNSSGDFFKNYEFNKMAYALFEHTELFIMDLGCGDGGFLEDCLNDNHKCVGVDGWPLHKELKSKVWNKYENNFFLADIGKPFQLYYNDKPIKFDLITSWEFFEHILTEDVPILIQNIKKHLKNNGYLIFSASISNERCHLTKMDKSWWIKQFMPYGFVNTDIDFYPHVIRNCPQSSFVYLKYIGD